MGAKKNGIQGAAMVPELTMHFVVNTVESSAVEEASSEARLIGGNDDSKVCPAESGNRFQAAWERLPLLSTLDIGIGITIDNPIPVEYDEAHWVNPLPAVVQKMLRL
jgi:hypothetical protein